MEGNEKTKGEIIECFLCPKFQDLFLSDQGTECENEEQVHKARDRTSEEENEERRLDEELELCRPTVPTNQ